MEENFYVLGEDIELEFRNFKSYMAKDEQTSLNGCVPLYFNLTK